MSGYACDKPALKGFLAGQGPASGRPTLVPLRYSRLASNVILLLADARQQSGAQTACIMAIARILLWFALAAAGPATAGLTTPPLPVPAMDLQTILRAQLGSAVVSGCPAPTILKIANQSAAGASAPFQAERSPGTVSVHDEISFVLEQRDDVAQCLGASSEPILFIDHLPMQGLPTTGRYVDKDKVRVTFRLERPASTQPSWNELLQRAWQNGNDRQVDVGMGVGGAEVVVAKDKITLHLGSGKPEVGALALVFSIVALVALGCGTAALKDRRTGDVSYSLSRLVLASWVLTASAAVMLLLMHTGLLPSFSDGGLAVMLAATGIGSGASTLMDQIREASNPDTKNVLKDFFEDADGFALHRVQVALFNLLVLVVVWHDLILYGTVALVDKSWSALVGASTVTYLLGRMSESATPKLEPST